MFVMFLFNKTVNILICMICKRWYGIWIYIFVSFMFVNMAITQEFTVATSILKKKSKLIKYRNGRLQSNWNEGFNFNFCSLFIWGRTYHQMTGEAWGSVQLLLIKITPVPTSATLIQKLSYKSNNFSNKQQINKLIGS